MTTETPSLTDFLLARIAEDEEQARLAIAKRDSIAYVRPPVVPDMAFEAFEDVGVPAVLVGPERVLAECEAKRRIVEWHKSWPVLVETPPKFEPVDSGDVNSFAMRVSQQMAWATEQAYRDHFGTEPPTGPVLRFLALPYADRPDYREEWRP